MSNRNLKNTHPSTFGTLWLRLKAVLKDHLNIKFTNTIIVFITLLTSFIPSVCSSNETIVDKSLNVKLETQVIIQEMGEKVTTNTNKKIPNDIVEAVNNNYPVELDKQLEPWLQWYKQNIVKETFQNIREWIIKKGVILHHYALVKKVNLSGNKFEENQNLEDIIVVYQIGNVTASAWAVSIFKKENKTYKQICETPVNNLSGNDFRSYGVSP